jgi:hypothetical protein
MIAECSRTGRSKGDVFRSATVSLQGRVCPQWTFSMTLLPGDHVVTTALAPPAEAVDEVSVQLLECDTDERSLKPLRILIHCEPCCAGGQDAHVL